MPLLFSFPGAEGQILRGKQHPQISEFDRQTKIFASRLLLATVYCLQKPWNKAGPAISPKFAP